MKKLRRVIIIFLLIIFYCYVVNISNFPKKLFLYSDSKFDFRLCPFLKIEGDTFVSSDSENSNYNLKLTVRKNYA